MKSSAIALWVIVAGRALVGCSDDGVYTPPPVEYDAGAEEAPAELPPPEETSEGGSPMP